jgi:hypothetical protein
MKNWITIRFNCKLCIESYGDSYADSDTCRRPLTVAKNFEVLTEAKENELLLLSAWSTAEVGVEAEAEVSAAADDDDWTTAAGADVAASADDAGGRGDGGGAALFPVNADLSTLKTGVG